MHDHARNSDNSGLRRHHIHKTEHAQTNGALISIDIKGSNNYKVDHLRRKHSYEHNVPAELIPGISLNNDSLAESRRHYLLPNPEEKQEALQTVNLDCCCEDFSMGDTNYMKTLSYQASPSELSRIKWDREGGYFPELF
jgi:hypothetical protein